MADLRIITSRWLKDKKLQAVLKTLSKDGGEARIAGGAVRNAVLRLPVNDIDIATTHLPADVMRLCKAAGYGVHPTGIEHGTLTIVMDHVAFEVTTLRSDVETDGRRAVVAFTANWPTDAARRDFTMNAMYCDCVGKIYDFTEGYRDCVKQRVKFVGRAETRIDEDALRILRFFRFTALYGKSLDANGLSACVKARRKLKNLSTERVRSELLKLLAATRFLPVLKVMAKSGILGEVLPFTDDWRVLGRLPSDPLLLLFVLARHPTDLKACLKLTNEQGRRLENLSGLPLVTPELLKRERLRILYTLGPELWRDAVALSLARSTAALGDRAWKSLADFPRRNTQPKFPLKGKDLIAAGLAHGPSVGQALLKLEDWWIASDFKPTREQLLARIGK
jgi:poly(A) polymerase